MSKIGILAGIGVGYVLGAKAGRERYDQIEQQARKLWRDPRVQDKKDQAVDVAKQKGSELQDKAAEKIDEATSNGSGGSAGSTGSGGQHLGRADV